MLSDRRRRRRRGVIDAVSRLSADSERETETTDSRADLYLHSHVHCCWDVWQQFRRAHRFEHDHAATCVNTHASIKFRY